MIYQKENSIPLTERLSKMGYTLPSKASAKHYEQAIDAAHFLHDKGYLNYVNFIKVLSNIYHVLSIERIKIEPT